MEDICFILLLFLLFKDMSGKEELRKITKELEKMNERIGNVADKLYP